eukprot:Hpha_TRINITY_DN15262_c1_g13::TRINITY_DN15262_c1_g13_i1::g.64308::m.64308
MAAQALHGWPHAETQQRPPLHVRRQAEQARRLSDFTKAVPTRFAHLARLPGAAVQQHAADQVSAPSQPMYSEVQAPPPRRMSQPPLQGRLRPPRRAVGDTESRSGSEQGMTPEASPRDPSPKPPASLAARRASLRKELPAPNGLLRSLNPALVLGMGGAAASAAMIAAEEPGGKLYRRRVVQTRAADAAPADKNWGRTGHSVWGRRRR